MSTVVLSHISYYFGSPHTEDIYYLKAMLALMFLRKAGPGTVCLVTAVLY